MFRTDIISKCDEIILNSIKLNGYHRLPRIIKILSQKEKLCLKHFLLLNNGHESLQDSLDI